MQLPYLTADLPGIGGFLKTQFEDFAVEEVPLYEASGTGTHAYIQIQKRGYSTMEAARLIAKAIGRKSFDIGYAGLKDTRAVTTQWFSVEHEYNARFEGLALPPGLKILQVSRHKNKIKLGHLAGNKFIIKVRNPEWQRVGTPMDEIVARAVAVLERLEKSGVPNFFGPQRFGMRKDNHLLGLALLREDYETFIKHFLGNPDEDVDRGDILSARKAFMAGEFENALNRWPGHLRNERVALNAVLRGKGAPSAYKRAVHAIDHRLKDLLISALQSWLFNQVLERRLPKFTAILPGDLCEKHENGAVFVVGDEPDAAMKEQARADAHEISPTGPLFGHRMSEAGSVVKLMEESVLKSNGLSLDNFAGRNGARGTRRALRFFVRDMAIGHGEDEHGPFIEVRFTLPSGSYATVLLGEVMKTELALD